MMFLMLKITQPLVFVTGKGGVGKSVVAASLALSLAKKNKKTLLVELGDRSFYQHFFKINKVGFDPVQLAKNLDVAIWNATGCLRQYVSFYVKIEKIYDLFFENRVMKEVINASPALKELALLGKITSGIRNVGPALNYDHIVIDSYSTGHHKALLMAPKGISKIFKEGPMGSHSKQMTEVVESQSLNQNVVVFKPEDLPTTEAIELYHFLSSEFKLSPTFIANGVLQFPLSMTEMKNAAIETPSYKPALSFYEKLIAEQNKNIESVRKIKNIEEIPFIFEAISGMELITEIEKNYELSF